MGYTPYAVKIRLEELYALVVNTVVERLLILTDKQGNNQVAIMAPTRAEYNLVKSMLRPAADAVYGAVTRYSQQFTASTDEQRDYVLSYSFDTVDANHGQIIMYALQYDNIAYDPNLIPRVGSTIKDALVSKAAADWFALKGLGSEFQLEQARYEQCLLNLKRTLEQRIVKPVRKPVDF